MNVAAVPVAPAAAEQRPGGSDAPAEAAPVGTPDNPTIAGGVTRTVAIAVEPVAGMLPVDLGALGTGADRVLWAVSDLGAACAEGLQRWDTWLWIGSALLVAGGAAQAAAARAAPRPPNDPRNLVPAPQVVPGDG